MYRPNGNGEATLLREDSSSMDHEEGRPRSDRIRRHEGHDSRGWNPYGRRLPMFQPRFG